MRGVSSRADILTLLEPVLMAPLRREWDQVRTACLTQAAGLQEGLLQGKKAQVARARKAFDDRVKDFLPCVGMEC